MEDVKQAIIKQGSEPVASKSADDFANYVKAEIEKFRPVIKAAGLEGSE
jgi:tripartite-type tricarboxylate transporter receptor subunit TctC